MIIGLGHQRRQGKDAVADILVKHFGFEKLSYTLHGKLHEACMALNPIVGTDVEWNDDYGGYWQKKYIRYADVVSELGYEKAKDKYPEIVRTLQRMGTDVGRNVIGEDIWVNFAMDVAEDYEHVVFTNVRFNNEARAVKRAGGQCWKVTRPGFVLADRTDIAQHVSEASIEDSMWDRIIINDGTLDELEAKVFAAMREAM